VKEFVASTDGRLRLFVLPAYSPQLNPDEWVWKNVKYDRGRAHQRHRPRRLQDEDRQRAPATAEDAPRRPRFLRRPRPSLHHRMIRVH
jgi:hypothetical protein